MKISIVVALLMLLSPIHTFAIRVQKEKGSLPSQVHKGNISEIKGYHRVFVDTEKELQSENIIKELKKYQGVEVVTTLKDAEFVITYKIEKHIHEEPFSVAGAPPALSGTAIGVMQVYLPQGSELSRLVWETRMRYLNFAAVAGTTREWELPLEKSMTGKFIKALKKARGEK